jgi:hypothetical protein
METTMFFNLSLPTNLNPLAHKVHTMETKKIADQLKKVGAPTEGNILKHSIIPSII